MAEVRLIDANALIDAIPVVKDMDEEITVGGAVSDFICMISAQPTIDAVPVVRCKDCEYYENDECANPYIFMSDGAHMYTDPDDFCSYGERREENGD